MGIVIILQIDFISAVVRVLKFTCVLKAKDVGEILDLSKGTVSKILNYHKGLSKETIRKLSAHFELSQEAFNRPYDLVGKERDMLEV